MKIFTYPSTNMAGDRVRVSENEPARTQKPICKSAQKAQWSEAMNVFLLNVRRSYHEYGARELLWLCLTECRRTRKWFFFCFCSLTCFIWNVWKFHILCAYVVSECICFCLYFLHLEISSSLPVMVAVGFKSAIEFSVPN